MTGLPGAGKSSTVIDRLKTERGALHVSADEAKKLLDGYQDGLGAQKVHLNSLAVVDGVLLDAAERGDNIAFEVVGWDADKLRQYAADLRAKGYKVHLITVDVPAPVGVERAVERSLESGRLMPPDRILEAGDKPLETYVTLRGKGDFDSYELIDNDVARGSNARQIDRVAEATEVDSKRGMGRRGSGGDIPGVSPDERTTDEVRDSTFLSFLERRGVSLEPPGASSSGRLHVKSYVHDDVENFTYRVEGGARRTVNGKWQRSTEPMDGYLVTKIGDDGRDVGREYVTRGALEGMTPMRGVPSQGDIIRAHSQTYRNRAARKAASAETHTRTAEAILESAGDAGARGNVAGNTAIDVALREKPEYADAVRLAQRVGDEQGAEMASLNILSPQTVGENRGLYARRLYTSHENPNLYADQLASDPVALARYEQGLQGSQTGTQNPLSQATQRRHDLSPDQRTDLGEIQSIVPRVARGGEVANAAIARQRGFQNLADSFAVDEATALAENAKRVPVRSLTDQPTPPSPRPRTRTG